MTPTILTLFQLFGIGFSFGIAGPCLVSCTPALLAYLTSKKISWYRVISDASLFFIGRFAAYLILGFAAGFSGNLFRSFLDQNTLMLFHKIGGIVIILLGILVFIGKTRIGTCCARSFSVTSLFGLFGFGFVIGIAPCAPLVALLVEISLMSSSGMHGLMYASFFGLGTAFSGMLVIAALSGMINWIPQKYITTTKRLNIFHIICGFLLIGWGIVWIVN